MTAIQQTSDFYDRLARYYDVLNDWDSRLAFEGPFWRRLLSESNARTVLDAACGTGGHALAFADWGYDVVGADISTRMIDVARQQAARQEGTVADRTRFVVSSLGRLPRRIGPPVDVALCVGNSLPHLLTQRALRAGLSGLIRCLRPGGKLVLHTLNYDLRWQTRPRFFGVNSGRLDGREVLVWRFADYGRARLTFHIALFEQQGDGSWQVNVGSTAQRPVFRDDLLALLAELGVTVEKVLGAFDERPFDPQSSPDLIVVGAVPEQ
ncbi:MAG: class I SAM-dependent methyltransferase [Chloroflexi bacterium]|nr:class I SAM-dependent methyltransferase [Chloroflexota bacterium]